MGKKMKKTILFLALILSTYCFAQSLKNEASSSDTLKIEPLGDSITRGTKGDTYRNYLKTKLRNDAGIEVNFVGQCTNAADAGSVWADYPDLFNMLEGDIEHDGWGGVRIDQLTDMTNNTRGYPKITIEKMISDANADIILLMIGTNDIISQYLLSTAPARVDTIIRKILNSTDGYLIVSTIPPTPLPIANGRIQTFNSPIPAIVDSYKAQGKKISFIDINSRMGNSDISDDAYHPNSSGYEKIGIGWYDAIINFITDVQEGNNNRARPNKYGLQQNYPNPFNPMTKISYSIANQSKITLKVYDTLGNELQTLVKGEQYPGNYEVSFNASNLSSGIYFYRLTTESWVEIKKMVVAK